MSQISGRCRIFGVIGKPHGIKGFVYVRVLTDYLNFFSSNKVLYLEKDCREKIVVEEIKKTGSGKNLRNIFKFEGYDTRQKVESLRGTVIYRYQEDFTPELEEGSFWVEDLVGCEVFLKKNIFLGKVIDVENFAYNDNLIISGVKGKMILVPMYDEYIDSIDKENKKIFLKKIPEYI